MHYLSQPKIPYAKTGLRILELGRETKVMGIINMTPDSFSRDGLWTSSAKLSTALGYARKLIKEGADILDIGGESSRPGAQPISAKEEIRRTIQFIKKLRGLTDIPLSIDTYKPEVAQQALDNGVSIVNNIKGVERNKKLLRIIRNYNAAVVLMHMQRNPLTMQRSPYYKNLIGEIKKSLVHAVENCLDIGIKSDKIIIDPGIGFGKTVEDNLEILCSLKEFASLKKPILIGTSRKSFIGKVLGNSTASRLEGTLATVAVSVLNGAQIVRVHDVKEVKQVVKIVDAIKSFE